MKARTLLSIGVRLLALVLVVRSVVYIPTFVWLCAAFSQEEGISAFVASGGLAFVVIIAVAILFWCGADALAAGLVPADEAVDLAPWEDAAAHRRLFRLALRIVGAASVAWSVPEIAGQSARGFTWHSDGWWHLATILGGVIRLAVGIYLLMGGALLVRMAYGRDLSPEVAEHSPSEQEAE